MAATAAIAGGEDMKLAEKPNRYIALAFGGFIALVVTAIPAQAVPASGADLAPLVIGPRTLPVPTGEVSPEMQAIIAVKAAPSGKNPGCASE